MKRVGVQRVNSLTTRVADLQLFYNQYIIREKCTNIVYIYETYIVEVFKKDLSSFRRIDKLKTTADFRQSAML